MAEGMVAKTGRSKVLEETVATVQSLAADPAWRGRGYLPGLRDMARMAGCSHYTMWKAVKILEGRGVLEVRPGRRIRIPRAEDAEAGGAPTEIDPAQAGVQYKWERLRRKIEMDILSGALRPGEALPTLKELGARYGASFLTLKKALRALEGGIILHGGPGAYSVAPLRPPPRSILAYLAWGDEEGQALSRTPFDHEILGSLGNECARTGIRLETLLYADEGDRLLFHHARRAHAALPDFCREAFGFLVRTVAPRDVVPDLVPRLCALGKPVAVLDETGSPHLARLQTLYPNLAVFRHTLSGAPARQMGAYLAGLGHREAAFVSPFHSASWSVNRLAGLAECFRSLGPGYRVHSHTLELPWPPPYEETDGQDGAVETAHQALEKARKAWKAEYPALEGILERVRPRLREAVWNQWAGEQLVPVLDRALKRKEVTAWVAADDHTALMVLEHFRRKGLRPARDFTLVGFGDTAEGARSGLTSYSFDFPRFFHGVVMRLLDTPSLALARGRQPVEIEGRIVERASSGPPPGGPAGAQAGPSALTGGSRGAPASPGNADDTPPRARTRMRA